MKKTTLTVILIAAVCIVAGCIVMGIGLLASGFNLSNLGTVVYTDETQTVHDDFSYVTVYTEAEDVIFALSADGSSRIESHLDSKCQFDAVTTGDRLTLRVTDNRRWYEKIGLFTGDSSIRVYLPKDRYDSIKVNTASGDVHLPDELTLSSLKIDTASGDISSRARVQESVSINTASGDVFLGDFDLAGAVEVHTASGDVVFRDVNGGNVTLSTVSGECELYDVVTTDTLEVTSTSGDIDFERCDGARVVLKSTSGDIEGSLLTGKEFSAKTTSGSVRVPKSVEGSGECKANTTSGDIEIVIK